MLKNACFSQNFILKFPDIKKVNYFFFNSTIRNDQKKILQKTDKERLFTQFKKMTF